TLTIVKRVTNDNGGTKSVGDFGITTTAGALTFGAGADEGGGTSRYTSNPRTGLSAGSYSLFELNVTGYTEGTWSCNDGGTLGGGGVFNASTVTLVNGASSTCSITNDDMPGDWVVHKVAINDNGGTRVASTFTFKTTLANSSGNFVGPFPITVADTP